MTTCSYKLFKDTIGYIISEFSRRREYGVLSYIDKSISLYNFIILN
jgi:hypothetical protein